MSKIRYCKYCGGEIDSKTKICTQCGKNFARFKKIMLIIYIVLSAIFIGITSTLLIISYRKIDNICSENDDLKMKVEQLTNSNEVINNEFVKLSKENESLKDKYEEQTLKYSDDLFTLNWYQNDFAYGTENGEKYHKLTCSTLMNSNVVYGNTIEMWKRNGYEECSLCY